MISNIGRIICVLIFICICILLAGCQKQTINFTTRSNKVQQTLNELKETVQIKDTVKKSSGIIIYKDNSYQDNTINKKNLNFGPKDPDFDIKIRF